MPIHPIFAEAPKVFANDFVGRVRSGAMVNGRGLALQAFRFTTGDPEVAATIAEEYGGTPADWETSGDDKIEVYTEAPFLDIQLISINTGYVNYMATGYSRRCDGITQRDGADCFCREFFKSAKELAIGQEQGMACKPEGDLTFTLSSFPDMGVWSFNSKSKKFTKGDPAWVKDKMKDGDIFSIPIDELEATFNDTEGDMAATLQLHQESFTAKDGTPVSYTKPVLTLLEAVSA